MQKIETFPISDITFLIAIIGFLDPDRYPALRTKSLIYRCKDLVQRQDQGEKIIISVQGSL